jgi:hypothetical protein
MVRRAMKLGGLQQVIFICHSPLVRELAGRILSVGDGHVAVGDLGGVVSQRRPASLR